MSKQTPHILIIDDEPMILKLLSKMLTDENLKIDTASNGDDGINKIKSDHYDLIITDIIMPGLSGNQVAEHLKNTENNPPPIVGMSGTPWLLIENQFDAVLAKPIKRDTLFKIINKFV